MAGFSRLQPVSGPVLAGFGWVLLGLAGFGQLGSRWDLPLCVFRVFRVIEMLLASSSALPYDDETPTRHDSRELQQRQLSDESSRICWCKVL